MRLSPIILLSDIHILQIARLNRPAAPSKAAITGISSYSFRSNFFSYLTTPDCATRRRHRIHISIPLSKAKIGDQKAASANSAIAVPLHSLSGIEEGYAKPPLQAFLRRGAAVEAVAVAGGIAEGI